MKRDDRLHPRIAQILQYVAIVLKCGVIPSAGIRLDPRPRNRHPEDRTAEPLREVDVLAIAVPKIGRATAWHEPTHALPDVTDVVAAVIRLALVVSRGDAESKVFAHRRRTFAGNRLR